MYNTIHQKQKNLIKNALNQECPFHAYIFEGPRHIGKMQSALEAAVIILSKNKTEEETEVIKRKTLKKEHEDVVFFDQEKITIKDIRKLKERVQKTKQSPLIIIIDHFENINPEARHTLLKTLEEPTDNTFFFILAENKGNVLPTVLSRCQVVTFEKISDQEIRNILKEKNVSIENEDILHYIDGRLDYAVKYTQGEKIESQEHIEKFTSLLKLPLAEKIIFVEKIAKEEDIHLVFQNWISYMHRSVSIDQNILSQIPIKKKASILKNMIASKSLAAKNINKRLIMENICISL